VRIGAAARSWNGGEGFAAVDALVALTVLALTISLSLQSLETARRLAARTVEIRQASALLQYLVDAGAREPGDRTGVQDRLRWRLVVAVEPDNSQAPALKLCRRTATVTDAGSRRTYRLESLEFCTPRPGEP
jgi:hypothetical protein